MVIVTEIVLLVPATFVASVGAERLFGLCIFLSTGRHFDHALLRNVLVHHYKAECCAVHITQI